MAERNVGEIGHITLDEGLKKSCLDEVELAKVSAYVMLA